MQLFAGICSSQNYLELGRGAVIQLFFFSYGNTSGSCCCGAELTTQLTPGLELKHVVKQKAIKNSPCLLV